MRRPVHLVLGEEGDLVGVHQAGRQALHRTIAALMRQYGVRTIYTRDRDFRRFDGIAVENPFDS